MMSVTMITMDVMISPIGVWMVVCMIELDTLLTAILDPCPPISSSHDWSVSFSRLWARSMGVFIIICVDSGTKNHIVHKK